MTEPAPVAGVPPEAAPGGPAGAVGDASPDAPVPDLRKEVVRLNRRVQRLELTLQQLEEIRDANARVLDRLRSDLDVERARSPGAPANVLPQRIVDRLNAGEERIADTHEDVAILFSDFVGFTEIAGRQPVGDLVDDLGGLFAAFDAACDRHGVEKIKTIGDAYLAAAGLALHDDASDAADHAAVAAELALDMLDAVAASGSGVERPDRHRLRSGRVRRHRHAEVRLRRLGRHRERRQPAGERLRIGPDPRLGDGGGAPGRPLRARAAGTHGAEGQGSRADVLPPGSPLTPSDAPAPALPDDERREDRHERRQRLDQRRLEEPPARREQDHPRPDHARAAEQDDRPPGFVRAGRDQRDPRRDPDGEEQVVEALVEGHGRTAAICSSVRSPNRAATPGRPNRTLSRTKNQTWIAAASNAASWATSGIRGSSAGA